NAFEEAVRWQSPIGMLPREIAAETEFGGSALAKGTNVGLLLARANRAPEAFDDPDTFDVRRTARRHVDFGSAVHLWAGRWAAKSALAAHALPLFYSRLPDLQLATDRQPAWDGCVIRGPNTLPVPW